MRAKMSESTDKQKDPEEVVGRHALYKQGTRQLVYWLTKTAAQHCDLNDYIKSISTPFQAGPSKRAHATAAYEADLRSS